MKSPHTLLPALLFMVGCLDATPGGVAGDAGAHDGEPIGCHVPDMPDPDGCNGSGVLLEYIVREAEGGFAIGRCGVLAYWQERDGRELRLLSSLHDPITTYPDANGYGGEVSFSPSGRRLIASSLRSDLGFGDVIVGATPKSGSFAVDDTFRSPGHAEVLFDSDERLTVIEHRGVSEYVDYVEREGDERVGPIDVVASAGGRVFYLLVGEDLEPPRSRPMWPINMLAPNGETHEVAEVDRMWLEGSTQRTRGTFLVTGDGTRVIVAAECTPYGGGPCPTTAQRVIDATSGEVVAELGWWRGPKVGAGAIVAGETDLGATYLDAGGALHSVAGHVPEAVMRDHLLTRTNETVFALMGDDVRALAAGVVGVSLSSGGRTAAILHLADGPTRVLIWRDDNLAQGQADDALLRVEAVYDNGLVLATAERATLLFNADGALLERWDSRCVRNPALVADKLFFELCSVNDELHRYDWDDQIDQLVMEGHDFDYVTDPTGDYVAFTYIPLSGTVRELQAGYVP